MNNPVTADYQKIFYREVKIKGKPINLYFVVLVLLVVACSSEMESRIVGKWVLEGKVVGSFPTSYWFHKNGTVITPWEERMSELRSSGKYEFIGDRHIKLIMSKGPYREITFFFEVVKLDQENLTLQGSIQDVKMSRVK